MSIVSTKINKVKVKPLKLNNELSPDRILGYNMFPELYSNIFLCAKKKSGKTTVIYNILDSCADKDTNVMFFVSTIDKDASYKKILKMLDKKKINHTEYTDFLDDGVNIVNELVHVLNVEGEKKAMEEEDKKNKKQKNPIIKFEDEKTKEEIKEEKKKEKKVMSPEYILVFDDMGDALRNNAITTLLKKNRHYLCKVILSSQNLHDLAPSAIKQLDNILLFRSFDDEKLEKIYKGLDLNIGIDNFNLLYNYATEKPYNFLWVDNHGNYRKNFNEKLDISS